MPAPATCNDHTGSSRHPYRTRVNPVPSDTSIHSSSAVNQPSTDSKRVIQPAGLHINRNESVQQRQVPSFQGVVTSRKKRQRGSRFLTSTSSAVTTAPAPFAERSVPETSSTSDRPFDLEPCHSTEASSRCSSRRLRSIPTSSQTAPLQATSSSSSSSSSIVEAQCKKQRKGDLRSVAAMSGKPRPNELPDSQSQQSEQPESAPAGNTGNIASSSSANEVASAVPSTDRISSSMASALMTLEDFLSAAFSSAGSSRNQQTPASLSAASDLLSRLDAEIPSRRRESDLAQESNTSDRVTFTVNGMTRMVESITAIGNWSTQLAELESGDCQRECTALTEIHDWLTYITAESLRSVPLERLIEALVNILAQRSRKKRRSKVQRQPASDLSGEEDDQWMSISVEDEPYSGEDKKEASVVEVEVIADGGTEPVIRKEFEGPTAIIDQGTAARKLAAAECVQYILEIHPLASRFIATKDYIKVFCTQLGNIEYIDIGERLISCLQVLSAEIPERLLEAGAIKALLDHLDFFPLMVQQSIVMTVSNLTGLVTTKSIYNSQVQSSLSQYLELFMREDEQILWVRSYKLSMYFAQWTAAGLRRLVDAATSSQDDSLSIELFADLKSYGCLRRLLSLLTVLLPAVSPSCEQLSSASSITANGYVIGLDAIYLLSVFTDSDDEMAKQFLTADGLELVCRLLRFQSEEGQDPFLSNHVLSLLTSLLPAVKISPYIDRRKPRLMSIDESRLEIFKLQTDKVAYLCRNVVPLIVRSLNSPSKKDTAPSILTFFMCLTSLIRSLEERLVLITTLFESISKSSLFGFFSLTLRRNKSNPVISNTAEVACLHVLTEFAELLPEVSLVYLERWGLAGILAERCQVSVSTDREDLKLQQGKIYQHLVSQINEGHDQPRKIMFVNILSILKWYSLGLLSSLPSQTSLCNSVASRLRKVCSALIEAKGANSVAEECILGELKVLLTEQSVDGLGVTPFELSEAGLIDALQQYLLGGTVSKPAEAQLSNTPVPDPTENELQFRRLQGFVQALCGNKQDGPVVRGLKYHAADLRPLLFLSQALVVTAEEQEQFPLRLQTHIHEDSRDDTRPNSATVTSSLRHAPPSQLPPNPVDTLRNIANDQPTLQKWLDVAVDGSLRSCAEFSADELFDSLSTELKLHASVSVGDAVKFSSSQFCPESNISISGTVLAKRLRELQALVKALPVSETESHALLNKFCSWDIRDPGKCNELRGLSSTGDGPATGISLFLQLCVDLRTTTTMLQHSLTSHVEKQVAWLTMKLSKADSLPSPKETVVNWRHGISFRDGSSELEENEDEDVDPAIQSQSSGQEKSTRLLTTIVNQRVVPPHMTLAEALCRYADANLIRSPVSEMFNSSKFLKRSKGSKRTTTAVAHVEADVGNATLQERGRSACILRDAEALLEADAASGIWLLTKKDKTFSVWSVADERSRSFEVRKASLPESPGSDTQDAAVTLGNKGEAFDGKLLLGPKPLWLLEHPIDANLSAPLCTHSGIDAEVKRFTEFEKIFFCLNPPMPPGSAEEEVIYFDPATVSKRDLEDIIRSKLPKVSFRPIPESAISSGPSIKQLEDGTILFSLGEALGELLLSQSCQCLGLVSTNVIDAVVRSNRALLTQQLSENEESPLGYLKKLSNLIQHLDFRAFTSPILCNRVRSEFSQASLFASISTTLSRALDRVDESSSHFNGEELRAIPSIVLDQMKLLRGWKTTRFHADALLAASFHETSVKSIRIRCPKVAEDASEDVKRPAEDQSKSSVSDEEAKTMSVDEIQCSNVENRRLVSDSPLPEQQSVPKSRKALEVSKGEVSASSESEHDVDDDEEDDDYEDESTSEEVYEEAEENLSKQSTERGGKDDNDAFTINDMIVEEATDIFVGNETLAATVQLILLVFRLLDSLKRRNLLILSYHPNILLTDVPNQVKKECPPLYVPTAEQLSLAQCSSVFTAKTLQQLSDPVAVASAKIPSWLLLLSYTAPQLFSLHSRRLLHTSSARGIVAALASFKDRLRRDTEILGGLMTPAAVARRPKHCVKQLLQEGPLRNALLENGLISSDQDTELFGSEELFRPDPTLVRISHSVFGLGDGNRRKQARRAGDVDQVLARQRTKIRLGRNDIFSSAAKVVNYFHANHSSTSLPAAMEIEFLDEEGSGSGPTLEFYAEVFDQAIAMKSPQLFRSETPQGFLFPHPYKCNPELLAPELLQRSKAHQPIKVSKTQQATGGVPDPPDVEMTGATSVSPLDVGSNSKDSEDRVENLIFGRFKLLGQLFAKAILDGRLVDLPLNPAFWRLVTTPDLLWPELANEETLSLVDPILCRNLLRLREVKAENESLEMLEVFFILPGSNPEIEVVPGGSSILVNKDNLEFFIASCCEWVLWRGIALQICAFRFGIATFMPLQSLTMFSPIELSGGVMGCIAAVDREDFWSLEHLKQAAMPDHGFTHNSRVFQDFLKVVSELNKTQRRQFLKFCTGTSVLPRGGFVALRPSMRVVRKEAPGFESSGAAVDSMLPSVMACTNYIKLPNYSTKEHLRIKLLVALAEGQGAFTLS